MAEAVLEAPGDEDDEPRYRAAFHALAEERAALTKDEVLRVNADPELTVTTMLGAWPAVRALRARIAEELPRFDLERFDRFEQYVYAFSHAHTRYVSTGAEQAAFQQLCQAGIARFNQLFADATAAAKRGLISDQPLARLPRGNGYRRVPINLLTVVQLLRMNWDALEGRTAVTRAELDAAEVLGETLLRAIAESRRMPESMVATRDDRRRAFTLFVRLYEELRAAVRYVRRKEGDGERILPTIYGGRAKRRKRRQDEPANLPSGSASGPGSASNMPQDDLLSEAARAAAARPPALSTPMPNEALESQLR